MNLFEVGSYIKWLDTPEARVDVVLWIAANRSNCVCIDTNSKNKCAGCRNITNVVGAGRYASPQPELNGEDLTNSK